MKNVEDPKPVPARDYDQDYKTMIKVVVNDAEMTLGDLSDMRAFHKKMLAAGLVSSGISLEEDTEDDLLYRGHITAHQLLQVIDAISGFDNYSVDLEENIIYIK